MSFNSFSEKGPSSFKRPVCWITTFSRPLVSKPRNKPQLSSQSKSGKPGRQRPKAPGSERPKRPRKRRKQLEKLQRLSKPWRLLGKPNARRTTSKGNAAGRLRLEEENRKSGEKASGQRGARCWGIYIKFSRTSRGALFFFLVTIDSIEK